MIKLINLPYNYNKLKPYIDNNTVKTHYTKHHQEYVNKLNNLIKVTKFENKTLKEIIINTTRGSFDIFKNEFIKKATTNFGSGRTWLIQNNNKTLSITNTSNEETPLLTIDVWKHAYYLKYQNRRHKYLKNIFNIINWDFVSK